MSEGDGVCGGWFDLSQGWCLDLEKWDSCASGLQSQSVLYTRLLVMVYVVDDLTVVKDDV